MITRFTVHLSMKNKSEAIPEKEEDIELFINNLQEEREGGRLNENSHGVCILATHHVGHWLAGSCSKNL